MLFVHQTVGSILCCKCGIPTPPSNANMCDRCLISEYDITEGLQRLVILVYCPKCESYLQPPTTWIKAHLGSTQLLQICVNRVKKNVNKFLRLVDAAFVWTEPHSKRIKVNMTVERGSVKRSYFVEYVVQDQLCHYCLRVDANPDQWEAVVQLRQHAPHMRTLFYLEQLILKHDGVARAIKIKPVDHGIDFFFDHKSHALKFIEFVEKFAAVKKCPDKKLVSQDWKSNTCYRKFTFSVEISPICREDLICLPPDYALSLGNIGPLVICTKAGNTIHLFDPFTLKLRTLNAEQYWRSNFKSFLASRQLVKYIVLDVEIRSPEVNVGGVMYAMADAQVARVSDFGKNDTIFYLTTYLGNHLRPGDYALGYDLYGANTNVIDMDNYKRHFDIPDAILIKRCNDDEKCLEKRPSEIASMAGELQESFAHLDLSEDESGDGDGDDYMME